MKVTLTRLAVALLALWFTAAPVVAAAAQGVVQRLDATVIRVIDGTTIEVRLGDRAEVVRYLGVRELRMLWPGATTAQDENESLVGGQRVALVFKSGERKEREAILAHLYVGTRLVGAELVRRGYAEVAPAGLTPAEHEEFAALEKDARASSRGLWKWLNPSGQGESVGEDAMPSFPWPPPQWTSRVSVPAHLLSRRQSDRLGDLFDRITAALTRGGIEEWSAYSIGADGFAVAARMERINDDGSPFPEDERWGVQLRPASRFTLADYVKALFTAGTGRYRVIVVVATPRSVVADPQKDSDLARRWPSSGASQLPPGLRTQPAPPAVELAALIYEFYRPSADDDPAAVQPAEARILARQHLVGAGLWKAREWK